MRPEHGPLVDLAGDGTHAGDDHPGHAAPTAPAAASPSGTVRSSTGPSQWRRPRWRRGPRRRVNGARDRVRLGGIGCRHGAVGSAAGGAATVCSTSAMSRALSTPLPGQVFGNPELAVEMDVGGSQPELTQQVRAHRRGWRRAARRRSVSALRSKSPTISIMNGPSSRRAVAPGLAGRRRVPVAPGPQPALRVDGQVLCDVAPAVLHHVEAAHRLDGGAAAEVGAPWSPGVVQMHRDDLPREGRLRGDDQVGELGDGKTFDRGDHATTFRLRPARPWDGLSARVAQCEGRACPIVCGERQKACNAVMVRARSSAVLG